MLRAYFGRFCYSDDKLIIPVLAAVIKEHFGEVFKAMCKYRNLAKTHFRIEPELYIAFKVFGQLCTQFQGKHCVRYQSKQLYINSYLRKVAKNN